MNVLTMSNLLQKKKVNATELVTQTLKDIKTNNSVINSFITICEESAMDQAKAVKEEMVQGITKGPLHGIPIAVKDVIFTKNIRTTMGSKLYKNFIPDYDATVVQRLVSAGAITIGKTHTHEFAFGPTGDRSYFGPCRNPINPTKITGGSSSGSAAAVASGAVPAAIGTDTGGSVRIPASACGIIGLKPTFGLLSKYGIYNTAYSLDHPGPMTKTIKDNAILLNALAGYDAQDEDSLDYFKEDYTRLLGKTIEGKVIGIPTNYFGHIDDEVKTIINKVIGIYEQLGARVEEVKIEGIEEISVHQKKTIQAEAYAVHENNMRKHPTAYGDELYKRLQSGKEVSTSQYILAQRRKKQLIHDFNAIYEKVDVLLTPTLPILPTNIDQRTVTISEKEEPVRNALLRFTAPTNYTGNPSISIPGGYATNGLPIGFQLIGKHRDEALLYQIGRQYEFINRTDEFEVL